MTSMYTIPLPDESLASVIWNAIKRTPGELRPDPMGPVINLGSGNAPLLNRHGVSWPIYDLDRPNWEAPRIPFADDQVAVVHMHHFLEHLDPDTAVEQLKEVERVLIPGGNAYITVPHAMCPLAYQAPDHKSFWTEEGLQDTFYSAGYDSAYGHKWQMDITWMMVGGIKWSNLCVMAQLAKQTKNGPYDTPWRRDG